MRALNQLLPLYLSCTLLLMGNGLLFIIIPMSMRLDGQDTDAIGLVMSLYFVGMLLGSLLTPKMIQRVGHIRIFAALSAVASVTILIHAIYVTIGVGRITSINWVYQRHFFYDYGNMVK